MENENNYYNSPEPENSVENQDSNVVNQQDSSQSYGQPNQQSYGQSYGQPNQQSYGQSYGQPNQQSYGQSYGQPNQQDSSQSYGQPNQQESSQSYGQPNQQSYGQSYGQPNQQGYGQSYGQPNQQGYGQSYGQSGYGTGAVPMDKNGQPLKNNYAMKLTFSILEILCCCGCNIVTMILGIIACVFTSQANTAYKEGRWDDFKAKSKSATILLWVGFGIAVVYMIISILAWTVGGVGDDFREGYEQGYEAAINNAYGNDDDYDYDYDYDYDAEEVDDETDAAADAVSEPVSVIPGEGFTDPTITVNAITVTFPLTYPELVEAGFHIDAEDEEYVINKNEYDYPTLYDASGEEIGYVYIGNETEGALPMTECTVFGFEIDSYALEYGDVTFSLPNGLTQDATKEDFIAAFGEPDYEYESDSNDYQSYQWYNHSDLYYDSEQNSITVDYWDGALDSLEMKYIGWD